KVQLLWVLAPPGFVPSGRPASLTNRCPPGGTGRLMLGTAPAMAQASPCAWTVMGRVKCARAGRPRSLKGRSTNIEELRELPGGAPRLTRTHGAAGLRSRGGQLQPPAPD